MDVAKYKFGSQKALHRSLQYARSFGHQYLECEHVALAMVRSDQVGLEPWLVKQLERDLQEYLTGLNKVFGSVTVEFGPRLDQALDAAEKMVTNELIDEELMWNSLVENSEVLQDLIASGRETGDVQVEVKKADPPNEKKPKKFSCETCVEKTCRFS